MRSISHSLIRNLKLNYSFHSYIKYITIFKNIKYDKKCTLVTLSKKYSNQNLHNRSTIINN